MFFVYDSYLTPASDWADLLSPNGKGTIRNTKYDSAVIGLWVKKNDGEFMTEGCFDGVYTYFASDGFVYGSTTKNWPTMAKFARENKLLFIPSVGPGYVDTRIRPWNGGTTRLRDGGRYYDKMFEAALRSDPRFISITSYNEWHEGTQIEPAVPKKIKGYSYESYQPLEPDYYLKQTAHWIDQFERKTR
jgi:glycoprotein endo-alpha-1,2-mannosidase